MKIFSKFLHFFLIIICLLLQIVFFEYLKMYYIISDLIIVGISAFIYAIDSFIVNKLITAGFKPAWTTYSFLVFLVTEINILILNLVLYLFNFSIDWSAISLELLVRPVCNIILMFIIFPLIKMSSGRSESEEIKFGVQYKDKI
jgi:hypothetical protein